MQDTTPPPPIPTVTVVQPGVWRVRFGTPEPITPISQRRSSPLAMALPGAAAPPLDPAAIRFRTSRRGCVVTLPSRSGDGVLGLGLQLRSVQHAGKKRTLRVNADPTADMGDSHAPVPFFLSTAGYAVLVDTARYASFWFGTHTPVQPGLARVRGRVARKWGPPAETTEALYACGSIDDRTVIEVPAASGVDLYLFAGPTTRDALRRYVAFSGGGCLPPLWGLGPWYRGHTGFDHGQTLACADQLAEDGMPFTTFGLEPGWQQAYYPNTFTWSSERFPDPDATIAGLHRRGLRVNLWENPFVHPDSPIAPAIAGACADETSTDGLAPDLLHADGYRIFSEHHRRTLVARGVDGFKGDECDNGDFNGPWSFPEHAIFPSGADGEQMHSLYGVHYQHCLDDAFRDEKRGHFGLVRSSGALASSLPFVLYSDLYDHRDFLRGMVTAGSSGLLWSPEVRHADSADELVRRVQSVVLSPLALINCWYMKQPPWRCIDREAGNRGERMPGWERVRDLVRAALDLRMRLRPVLYTAFARYRDEGIPPFRALAVEHPDDQATWNLDDQWYVGDDLIAAPVLAGTDRRTVYLPVGRWRRFSDGQLFTGGMKHELAVGLADIPLFVRDGALLPLAEPGPSRDSGTPVRLHAFAEASAEGRLWSDDGGGTGATGRMTTLRWRSGQGAMGGLDQAAPLWLVAAEVACRGSGR